MKTLEKLIPDWSAPVTDCFYLWCLWGPGLDNIGQSGAGLSWCGPIGHLQWIPLHLMSSLGDAEELVNDESIENSQGDNWTNSQQDLTEHDVKFEYNTATYIFSLYCDVDLIMS